MISILPPSHISVLTWRLITVFSISTARAVLSPNYESPGRPKIRYILSLVNSATWQPKIDDEARQSEFVFKLILLSDKPESDLLLMLKDACEFIRTSLLRQNGDVLVHCQQGISRSSAVIIAYIMRDMNLDFDTALKFVRNRRSKIKPNVGFEKQLRLWYNMKYNIYDQDGRPKQQYLDWKSENELTKSG